MAELTFNIKTGLHDGELKREVDKLRNLIKERQEEINLLQVAITAYTTMCKHVGRSGGYNDRDGDWFNPCPTCGSQR